MGRLDRTDRTVAYAPEGARGYFEGLAPRNYRLVAQQGADPGERLANALAHHFDLGYKRAVIMNSDGPTLPQAYLEEAFGRAGCRRCHPGRQPRRGYYLIGMKQLHPELFQGIDWSTERVFAQTVAVHQLPEWYDVDVGADLERLSRDLARDPASAPRTRAFLHSWATRTPAHSIEGRRSMH